MITIYLLIFTTGYLIGKHPINIRELTKSRAKDFKRPMAEKIPSFARKQAH